jgi:hypothetical protein
VIPRRYLALLLAAFLTPLFLIVLVVTSHANGPKLINHTFQFDGRHDGWAKDVDLLAYSYGGRYSTVQQSAREGQSLPSKFHFSGAMPRGEFLYVRWRIRSTGEVVEERVDLQDRLPEDILGNRVAFVIEGKRLNVLVNKPEKLGTTQ